MEIVDILQQALTALGVNTDLLKIVEGILTGGTTSNIIKAILIVVLLGFAFWFNQWKKKQAKIKTEKRRAEEEARVAQSGQAQQQSSSTDADVIDDILGDKK